MCREDPTRALVKAPGCYRITDHCDDDEDGESGDDDEEVEGDTKHLLVN